MLNRASIRRLVSSKNKNFEALSSIQRFLVNPFERTNMLAAKFQAVNMGQGFPDGPTHQLVQDAMLKALDEFDHSRTYQKRGNSYFLENVAYFFIY